MSHDYLLSLPHVRVFGDGREVCITAMTEPMGRRGREEYRSRTVAMWERQQGICCLHGICPNCPGPMRLEDATFDHEKGRGSGGGKRDDRITLSDGRWINGAAHWDCNNWKGSRRINYNAGK
jgi:hypothetical protein